MEKTLVFLKKSKKKKKKKKSFNIKYNCHFENQIEWNDYF